MPGDKCVIGKSKFGKTLVAARPIRKGALLFREEGELTPLQTKYSYQVGWDIHYEPKGPSAFINHSCEPNAFMKVTPGGKPRFYALRSIRQGEEIVIDYATFEYRTAVFSNVECLCGSPKCRKNVRGYHALSEADKKRLSPQVVSYLKTVRPKKP